MNADLKELQESARQVLDGLGLAADEERVWPLVTDLGWLLVSVPQELDGLGQGLAGACAIHGEMGRSLAGGPFLSAMLAIDAVCHSQLAEREAWVRRLTSTEYVAVQLADGVLAASRDASGRTRVSGLVPAVPSADKASHVLVYVSQGECLALVPVEQSGVRLISRPTWDVTRRLFDVQLENVALDEAVVLSSGPAARELYRRIATHRDFALAADAIGGANALLDMTVEYLKARRQFGRPLAMFQALKHRCADLKALTTAAEALLVDSLQRLDERALDAQSEVMGMTVKHFACTAYARVAEEAVQLHGAVAMTAEHACHRFLKRALLNEQLGRSADSYELGIAASVIDRHGGRAAGEGR